MATILDKIVATKRQEVERARARCPRRNCAQLDDAPPVRDFLARLGRAGPIRLIAEVKKASPSKGVIRADFDPVAIAQTYQAHGAACLSVLTDEQYFQGSLEYLRQVRAAVDLPVLRKDFVIDPYQVLEARAAGADAVLLIAECLDDRQLAALHEAIVGLGMTPLVELYEPENLARVLRGRRPADRHQQSQPAHLRGRPGAYAASEASRCPPIGCVVGESGIRTRADVQRLEAAGVRAMLVGESLVTCADVGAAVDRLLGHGEDSSDS